MSGSVRPARWGMRRRNCGRIPHLGQPGRLESSLLSIDEYKAIFDAFPDGCLVVSSGGEIRAANARIEELFGWTSEDLVGESVDVLIPSSIRDAHAGHRGRFVSQPHNRPMGVGLDLQGERKDGSTFPVEVSLSPWTRDDGELSVICTVRDVSDYRRLQNFSEGALRATEEERKRIARELHDDTAQRLVTLILRVRTLAEKADHTARHGLCERLSSFSARVPALQRLRISVACLTRWDGTLPGRVDSQSKTSRAARKGSSDPSCSQISAAG